MSKLTLPKVKAAIEDCGSIRAAAAKLEVAPGNLTLFIGRHGLQVVKKAVLVPIRYEIAPEVLEQMEGK